MEIIIKTEIEIKTNYSGKTLYYCISEILNYYTAIQGRGGFSEKIIAIQSARLLNMAGKSEEAHKYIDRAISLDEKDELAILVKGAIYQCEGQFNNAIDYLKNSLAFLKDPYRVYEDIGNTYIWLDNPGEAINWLLKAKKINNDSYNLNIFLGRAFARIGNYLDSSSCYHSALNKVPDSRAALIGISANAYFINEYEESIEWASKVLGLDPMNCEALEILFDSKIEVLGSESAREVVLETKRKFANKPDNYDVITFLIPYLIRLGLDSDSEETIKWAMEEYALDAELFRKIAEAYGERGKYKISVEYCDKTLTIDPENRLALLQKARSSEYLNKKKAAFRIYSQILDIYPGDIGAIDGIARTKS